jgi:hypothetical protein
MGPTRDHKTTELCPRCLMTVIITLRNALDNSKTAIDDWICMYASDMCAENHVAEAYERVSRNGGTLAYTADINAANRNALHLAEIVIGMI